MTPRPSNPIVHPPRPSPRARARGATRLAFAFLTIVPIKVGDDEATPADLATSRFAYPLVGGAIGLLLAALSELLRRQATAPGVSAFLLVSCGVAITGGLHLDGLADTSDGLFLHGGAERRLVVMRDPHVGSFGVIAIVLVLLGKFAALAALPGRTRTLALLAGALVARALVLVAAGSARYARREGTGRSLIDATTARDAGCAAAVVLVAAALLAGGAGIVAGVAALGLAWGLTRLAAARLGGITGDILGAVVELGELAFLTVLALAQPL